MKTKNKFLIIPAAFAVASIVTPVKDVHAASFYLSAPESVDANSPFTVTVGGDVVGRFDVSVSNGSSNTSSLFIESIGGIGSFTITPNGKGPVYVKVTATDAADSKYNTVSGAQGVTVNINKNKPSSPTSNNQTNSSKEEIKTENKETSEPTLLKENENVDKDKDKNEKQSFVEASLRKNMIYEVSASLDSADLIKGFEKKKIEIVDKNNKKRKIEVYQHLESKINVIYARLKGEKEFQFYLLDKTNETIVSSFKQVGLAGKTYGIVDDLNTFSYCKDVLNDTSLFKESTVNIDSASYRGFNYKDDNFKNYHLVYLMNEKGELMMYQYETTSETLQPYTMFIKTEIKNVKPISESSDKTSLTSELTLREKLIIAASSSLVVLTFIFSLIRRKRLNKKFKTQLEKIKETKLIKEEDEDSEEIDKTRILPSIILQNEETEDDMEMVNNEEINNDDSIEKDNTDTEEDEFIPDFKRKK